MIADNSPKSNTVLVVEDEGLLRLHVIDIVEEAGFVPVEAKNADEAILILESRPDIVLMITDIAMPGSLDGLKLARAVRDRWPPIKIIVVSGQPQPSERDMPSGSRFFAKPFESNKMIAELRSMLAA